MQVLLALCRRLYAIQQLRKGLADRLHDAKSLAAPDSDKQLLIDCETNAVLMQLQGAVQVREELLLLLLFLFLAKTKQSAPCCIDCPLVRSTDSCQKHQLQQAAWTCRQQCLRHPLWLRMAATST